MTVAVAQLRSEAEGEEEQAALFSSYLLKEFEGPGRAIREGAIFQIQSDTPLF